MTIGENIKRIRKEKKISQVELSGMVGVTQSFISKMETDSRLPNLVVSKKLAKVLDCEIEDFFK